MSRWGISIYFVPGNHDMWCQNGVSAADTRAIYRRYQEHPACLIGKSVQLTQDWVALGDIGLYDYSFGNKSFSEKEYTRKSMFDRTWQDSIFIDWQKTDEKVHRMMLECLEAKLAATSGKNRVVLTHMITTDYFTVSESKEIWTYFNAFLGSGDYGELFERYAVRYSIMGHVHYRRQLLKNGVSYVCSCLNYASEWQSADCRREIDEALTVIELQDTR